MRYLLPFLLAFLCTSACSEGDPFSSSTSGQQDPTVWVPPDEADTYVFECGEDGFTAHITPEKAVVFRDGGAITFTLSDSTSGLLFDNQTSRLHITDQIADLETSDLSLTGCSNNTRAAIDENARYRDVDFRAVGQEPGWIVELSESQSILYLANYATDTYRFPAPEPDRRGDTLHYDVAHEGHRLQLSLIREPCSDIMSGEKYGYSAFVSLNDDNVRGCADKL